MDDTPVSTASDRMMAEGMAPAGLRLSVALVDGGWLNRRAILQADGGSVRLANHAGAGCGRR